MDPVTKKLLIHGYEAISPISSPENSVTFHPHPHSSSTSIPIIALTVIGILTAAFLLLSYYIFIIKCCLNWHHIPIPSYSPRTQPRGLHEALIRLIPVIKYKSERNFSTDQCSVCLNEFREEEKVKIIPTCSHIFHIDCIDVWLQNNANCPVCRTSISISKIDQSLINIPQSEDFVAIELGNDDNDRESSVMEKEARRLKKVTSMGDEYIENRAKDEQFSVQPIIRRSVSMDSFGDRQFNLAVQEALKKQKRRVSSIEGSSDGGGSDRIKRSSFFTFRQSSNRSRSAVLPVYLDS